MQSLLFDLSSQLYSWFFSEYIKTPPTGPFFFQEIKNALSQESVDTPQNVQAFIERYLSISSSENTSYQDLWDQLDCAPDLYKEVRKLLETSSIEALSDTLLGYAEFCKRQDLSPETVLKVQEAALKFSMLYIAKQIGQKNASLSFYEIKEKIEVLSQQIDQLSSIQIVQVPLDVLEEVVKNIAPKYYSPENITANAKALLKEVQARLHRRLFQEVKEDECFVLSPTICWMKIRNYDEVLVTCYSSLDEGTRVLGGKEVFATEARFSLGKEHPIISTTKVQETKKIIGEKEFYRKRELMQRIRSYPDLPLTVYFSGDRSLINRGPNRQSLSNALEENPCSLSALDRLKICDQVLQQIMVLEKYDFISCNVRMAGIGIQRRKEGILGQLQAFSYLHSKGSLLQVDLDVLNRSGALTKFWGRAHPSADRNALIFLLAELFFLPKVEGFSFRLSRQDLERQAIIRIEPLLFSTHCQKILELWKQCEFLGPRFSAELLDYTNTLRSAGEETLQISILENFALQAAVIPKILDLLERAWQVELKCQQDIESGYDITHVETSALSIPSYEEIGKVLQEGKQEILRLQDRALLTREKTDVKQVDRDKIADLVRNVLGDSSPFLVSSIEAMQHKINQYIQKHPEVGSEKRFSKEDYIPFSFWVRVGKKHLEIDVIPSQLESLGVGGNKKAKVVLSFSEKEPLHYKTMSRGWDFPWGHKVHQAILQIPGASKYFADLPKIHAPYRGSKGIWKWEGTQPSYQINLYEALQKQEIPIDSERSIPLTTRHFLSFLQQIAQGIELIADHGISHGDLRRENVGIYLPSEKLYEVRITDFDHSSGFGKTRPEKRFEVYWNALRNRQGIISRETDLYSLILLIGETLLFDFSVYRKQGKEELVHIYAQRIPEDLRSAFPEGKITKENCISLLQRVCDLQNEGKIKESFALQRLVCESLILDKVFSLLEKTFAANQKSLEAGTFMDFPNISEVHEVLAFCIKESQWVEDYVHDIQTERRT